MKVTAPCGQVLKNCAPCSAYIAGTFVAHVGGPSHETTTRGRLNPGRLVPLLILLLAAGIYLRITTSWNSWVGAQAVQRTNDASLRADITPLSTRISGSVVQMAVEDYQRVRAGELLIAIKSNDYRAQVAQAEAGVRGAQAALENNQRQKEQHDSRIDQS